jgi:hypothetical protein
MRVHRWFRRWLYGLLTLLGLAALIASITWASKELASAQHLGAAEQAGILALPVAVLTMELGAIPILIWLAGQRKVDLIPAANELARAVEKVDGKEWARLLGDDPIPINLKFDFISSAGRNAEGMPPSGSFGTVAADYQGLRPRRLVITGKAGSGKTVLSAQLTLELLRSRKDTEAVPVRLSLSEWDMQAGLDDWLTAAVSDTYDLPPRTVRALVEAGLIVPVLDSLDEMDISSPGSWQVADGNDADADLVRGSPADVSNPRMRSAIGQLNDYRVKGKPGDLVIICRDDAYQQLEEKLHDRAWAHIRSLEPDEAADYLLKRATNEDRWWPACEALLQQDPHPVLADLLDTPWRLNLAFTAYDRDGGPEILLGYTEARTLRDDLLRQYVPTVTRQAGRADPEQVIDWLGNLAGYLQINSATGRRVGRKQLSGSDILLYELWPMGGTSRVRAIDGVMLIVSFVCLSSVFMATGLSGFYKPALAGLIILGFSAFIWWYRTPWPKVELVDFRHWPRRIVLWMVLAAGIGIGWWFLRKLPPLAAPALPIVLIIVLPQVVLPISGNLPRSTVRPRQVIRNIHVIGLLTWLLFATVAGLLFGTTTDLIDSVGGWFALALISGLGGMIGAISTTPLWRRYVAFLLATRGRLPWRLGYFLDWAADAGLMRMTGVSYQFRHRELQEYLADEFLATHSSIAHAADRFPSRPRRLGAGLALVLVWTVSTASISYLGDHTSLRYLQLGNATANLGPTFDQLNAAIKQQDEAKFLTFIAPNIRPRVRLWWENLRRLGLTINAVFEEAYPDGYEDAGSAAVNSHGNAVMTVASIVRSSKVGPRVSGSYRITVHKLPGEDVGKITSWKSLYPAPWDAPVKLYVRKTADCVVATYPDEHAAADREFASAVTAAKFTRSKLVLGQDTFFIFLSDDLIRLRDSHAASSTSRWRGESGSLIDTPSYLPSFSGGDPLEFPAPISWVISVPTSGSRATREMIEAFSLAGIGAVPASDHSTPNWVTVGYGTYLADLYMSGADRNSNPSAWLVQQLATLPRRMLQGSLPTDAELTRGSETEIEQWSNVSASVYAYVGMKGGVSVALQAIHSDSTQVIFGTIANKDRSSEQVERDWMQWLQSFSK